MATPTPSDGAHWLDDISHGDWIERGSSRYAFPARVADLVPPGFAAYARIFHPLRMRDGESARWSDVAAANGVPWHQAISLSQVIQMDRPRDPLGSPPLVGEWSAQLPAEYWAALESILERGTGADQVILGVWEGRSGLSDALDSKPRLELAHRRYFLAQIPLRNWTTSEVVMKHGPQISWPIDRAWFIASDIDCSSSYVAGSKALVNEILRCSDLEAAAAALQDTVHLP